MAKKEHSNKKLKKTKNILLGFNDKKEFYLQSHADTNKTKVHHKSQELDIQKSLLNITLNPIAKVAIMGRPNVGKSSLFNRLNQKNIAVTSPISGSTRDINKKNLRLSKFDICLIDTGGLEVVAHKLKELCDDKSKQAKMKITDSANPKNKDGIESVTNIHEKNLSNPKQQAQIAQRLKENISYHSYQVVEQSDIIIYMVDGRNIASDEDIKIFRELSKQKPTILVLNKIDNDKIALNSSEFLSFGVDFLVISITHNRGITKLLTYLETLIESLIANNLLKHKVQAYTNQLEPIELDFLEYFDNTQSIVEFQESKSQGHSVTSQDLNNYVYDDLDYETMQDKNNHIINDSQHYNIAVGIIGRPNVGKSSLLNALTNQNRSLVSNIAGTTIDPIDECIEYQGHTITFIDTAGIRRRSKIEGIEKYALDRTQRILKECDIALLVLDSSADFVELDEKISSIASNNELGVIVVFNKWDIRIKEFDERMEVYKRKFRFLEYAPVLTISSITHRHIKELKQKIIEVYRHFSFRIPTAQLNTCIQHAQKKHPLPSDHGKIVKIYYATQFDSKPPKIALIMNRPNALHFSYKRYLINILRETFDFSGTPIIIESRAKKQKTDSQP